MGGEFFAGGYTGLGKGGDRTQGRMISRDYRGYRISKGFIRGFLGLVEVLDGERESSEAIESLGFIESLGSIESLGFLGSLRSGVGCC